MRKAVKPAVAEGFGNVGRQKERRGGVEGVEEPEDPGDRDVDAAFGEEFEDAERLLFVVGEANDVQYFAFGDVGAEGLEGGGGKVEEGVAPAGVLV